MNKTLKGPKFLVYFTILNLFVYVFSQENHEFQNEQQQHSHEIRNEQHSHEVVIDPETGKLSPQVKKNCC